MKCIFVAIAIALIATPAAIAQTTTAETKGRHYEVSFDMSGLDTSTPEGFKTLRFRIFHQMNVICGRSGDAAVWASVPQAIGMMNATKKAHDRCKANLQLAEGFNNPVIVKAFNEAREAL